MHYSNFSQYWRIIVKRRLVIVCAAVLLLLLSAAYNIWKAFPPLYKSTCTVKFVKEASVRGPFSKIISWPENGDVETQQIIITGYDLLFEVARNLSLVPRTGSVSNTGVSAVIDALRAKIAFENKDTRNIIQISVTDSDPSFAQKMANTIAEIYSRQQSDRQQKQLGEAVKYIDEQVKTNRDKLKTSEEQFSRLSQDNQLISIDHQSGNLLLHKKELEDKIRVETGKEKLDSLKTELSEVNRKINDLMGKKIEFDRLKKDIDSTRSMVSFLDEKKREAMIGLAEKPDIVEIVKRAQLPSGPVNPLNILKSSLTGLIAGLLLVLTAAFFFEIFTNQTGLIDEIKNDIGLKIMGVIPQADSRNIIAEIKRHQRREYDDVGLGNTELNLASHFAPKTMIAESFRAIRDEVISAGEKDRPETITVTSSYPQEGKSMVSVNLAISLAQAGLETLLVGADFRNPALGRMFSIEESPGLTDILLGRCDWQDTIKTVTDMVMGNLTIDDLMVTPGLDNLNIIASGALPENSDQLAGSPRFAEFIDAVKKEYDIIILDSLPVLTNPDTAILGVQTGAILIVYKPELVSMEILKRTYSQLKQVRCNIMGVVLNGVKSSLIPDSEEHKYSQDHSSRASSAEQGPAAKDKIKYRVTRVLIPLAILLLLISGILWQRGILSPEKNIPPAADIKVAQETPVKVKTAEKEIIPQKKGVQEKSENIPPATDIKVVQQTPVKVKTDEKEIIPEKKEVQEKSKNMPSVEKAEKEETPLLAAESVKKNEEEKSRPDKATPQYQEGSYPYALYLGSYKTIGRMERAVAFYAEKGIDSFPVKVDFGEKGIWYRVYSGYYPDAESAGIFIEENKLKDAEIKKTAYSCLIGGFTDNESLERSMNLLREHQYVPYVITDHMDRVRFLFAGAFVTRKGAEELSEELHAIGIDNKVVSR
jgi:Mrp family chromosome partitioning ATPase/uncharacterized protein involved in exopolysaccharide biosynthesis